jgi:hypothetical protein
MTFALVLASRPQQAGGQNPWELLADFHSVGVSQVDDNAVVAVLFNFDDKLTALVIYPAFCDGEECVLSEPGAFFVLDQSGTVVRIHIEPGREAVCHPILASALKGFAVA